MVNRKVQTIATLIVLLSLTLVGSWPVTAQEIEHPRAAPKPTDLPKGVPGAGSLEVVKAGELLVKFREGVSSSVGNSLLAKHNANRIRILLGGDVELWQVPEGSERAIAAGLKADPVVEYAEPNYRYYAFGAPNDPHFGKQWAHTLMQSPSAWNFAAGSASTTIAIIDSGIDTGHPDLASKIEPGFDFVDNDSDPTDHNGHGTHVAGIAAAVTNNGVGVAGMDWQARIMPVRVLDAEGYGWNSDIAQGIRWAYQHGAKVINLSLGGTSYSQTMQDEINAAHSAGSLVVAAMGNCRTFDPLACPVANPTNYPAANDNVMAVAATDLADTYASYSQYGPHCDVSAPGGDMEYYHDPGGIYSTMPTYPVLMTTDDSYSSNYDYARGTSQATPYVSGLAALLWAVDPTLLPDEVQSVIQNTAEDLPPAGRDDSYGYGRIDALAALQSISPPQAPVLSSINNPDGDGNYTVDWDDVANATSYTLQEDDNLTFSSPSVVYSGTDSQHQVSGNGPGTWYYRVRATNDDGDSDWSTSQSVTVKPNAPTLDPISNPDSGDEYMVAWQSATAATSYILEEDDNASFTSPRIRYEGAALQYSVTGQSAGSWHYRVRAHNAAGNSPWSNIEQTTVDPLPLDSPDLFSIDNLDGDGEYLVDWSDVVSATSYLLEESDEPYFVAPTEVYSGAATMFSVSDQSGGHYYYRVRASGTDGKGPWSSEQSVTVTTWVYLPYVFRNYSTGDGGYGLPIDEGFEEGFVPPTGWTQIINNSSTATTTWSIDTGVPYAGVYYASVHYDPNLVPQDEILLSPEFQADSAQLQFYSFGSPYWCRDEHDNCDLKIWLVVGSWGGGDDIHVHTADDDWPETDYQWVSSFVDLTPHLPSDTPVRVGFQYKGLDGAQVALDAVSITK